MLHALRLRFQQPRAGSRIMLGTWTNTEISLATQALVGLAPGPHYPRDVPE